MNARAEILPTMFTAGAELVANKHRYVVTVAAVGDLHLPSGRVATGDVWGEPDYEPLSRTAPPGVYPVEVSIATVPGNRSLIAAARIVFSRQPVASWEVATGGTGAAVKAPSGLPGYSGPIGLFIDRDLVPALQKFIDASENPSEYWYEVPKTSGDSWEYALLRPDDDRPETCAMFQCGDTDGVFTSYWGLDASGAPVMLVTDFNVIP